MTREEKNVQIQELKGKLESHQFFYIADSSTLNVEAVSKLRRKCFESGVEFRVAKNTLVRKAMDACEIDYSGLHEVLVGPTALMFTEQNNAPAKIIKEFRKDHEKPVLKAAYIDSDIFIGDEQVELLSNLKSKEELVGEVITLLQSPISQLMSALDSGKNTLSGVIKTLSDKSE